MGEFCSGSADDNKPWLPLTVWIWAASGVTKCLVGHPFDTWVCENWDLGLPDTHICHGRIKLRLQTEGPNGRFRGPLHCLMTTVRKEGILAVYKGVSVEGMGSIDWSMRSGCIRSVTSAGRLDIHG
jgi:hypothetical protein